MITFAAPKERDSDSPLPVVLPAECIEVKLTNKNAEERVKDHKGNSIENCY